MRFGYYDFVLVSYSTKIGTFEKYRKSLLGKPR